MERAWASIDVSPRTCDLSFLVQFLTASVRWRSLHLGVHIDELLVSTICEAGTETDTGDEDGMNEIS